MNDEVNGFDTSDPATVEVLTEAAVNPEALSEEARQEIEAAAETLAAADEQVLDGGDGASDDDSDYANQAILAFGTEWREIRDLAGAAGVDFEAYKERFAAQVEAGMVKEGELIDAVVALFPPEAQAVIPSSFGVLHQLESARMTALVAMKQGMLNPDAASLMTEVITTVNNHVVGYVSATVTMVAKSAGIPEAQYVGVVLPAFNAVMANKRAVFELVDANSTEFSNAIREGMATRAVLPGVVADSCNDESPPTTH